MSKRTYAQRYTALALLSTPRGYVSAGETVNLAHLDTQEIAKLLQAGAVAPWPPNKQQEEQQEEQHEQ